jgi:nitrogen fixation protein FixH
MARKSRSLIPWLFPAAMLPVLAANGALIYLALQSKPALVDEHPFEDGRTYNRELAAAAAQEALGWRAAFDRPARAGRASPVTLELRDRDGMPVKGLAVELRVWRPVGALPEVQMRLSERSPGRYAASVTLPLAGQWQFDFVARRDAEEFVYAQRVVVP